MSLGFDGSSAYRTARARRGLVLDLRPVLDLTVIGTVLGLIFLSSAGWVWFDNCSADVVHRRVWPTEGGLSSVTVEHTKGPLTLSNVLGAWHLGEESEGEVFITRVHWGPAWTPVLLFLLALSAFALPRLAYERATLSLDEREDRASITRARFGTVERIQRPLRELREAVLVHAGRKTAAQLVFANGERFVVAAPPRNAAAQARLVSTVNEFISARA